MTLKVHVVSATEEVFSGEAEFVAARTIDGELGVLPGREPMLGILGDGEVRITLVGGEKITATAEGGFLSVENDTVTVVAGNAKLN